MFSKLSLPFRLSAHKECKEYSKNSTLGIYTVVSATQNGLQTTLSKIGSCVTITKRFCVQEHNNDALGQKQTLRTKHDVMKR
jgi:hypothetical protein